MRYWLQGRCLQKLLHLQTLDINATLKNYISLKSRAKSILRHTKNFFLYRKLKNLSASLPLSFCSSTIHIDQLCFFFCFIHLSLPMIRRLPYNLLTKLSYLLQFFILISFQFPQTNKFLASQFALKDVISTSSYPNTRILSYFQV